MQKWEEPRRGRTRRAKRHVFVLVLFSFLFALSHRLILFPLSPLLIPHTPRNGLPLCQERARDQGEIVRASRRRKESPQRVEKEGDGEDKKGNAFCSNEKTKQKTRRFRCSEVSLLLTSSPYLFSPTFPQPKNSDCPWSRSRKP